MSTLNNIIKVTKEQYDKLRNGERVNGHAYDESALYLVEDDLNERVGDLENLTTPLVDKVVDLTVVNSSPSEGEFFTLINKGSGASSEWADLADVEKYPLPYAKQSLENELKNLTQEVKCDHTVEITGITGHEYNLAIEDQQMLLPKIQGQTFTVNQLNNNSVNNSGNFYGVQITKNNDGSYILNGTSTSTIYFYLRSNINIISNHQYLILSGSLNENIRLGILEKSASWSSFFSGLGGVYNHTKENALATFQFVIYADKTFSNVKITPQLIDLTQWFGAGNEPKTVAEFYSRYNAGYIPYNEGTFKHSRNNLISTGRNLWDEQWFSGYYNANGIKVESSESIYVATKNYIPALPNTQYSSNKMYYWCFYDRYKNFINRVTGATITTPNNCYYITCTAIDNYGSTYNNDIIVNIGVTALEYEPYKEEVVLVNEEFKAFDYAQGNKKTIASNEIDLGTLNWQYNENGYFYADYSFDTTIGSGSANLNDKSLICPRYQYIGFAFTADLGDKQIMKTANVLKRIIIKDSSYNNATAFKQSMSGVVAVYKTTTSYEEDIDIPAGYSVYKNGYQIQDGQVPYILTKQYNVSTKSQILANIEVDREQQKQLNDINTRIDNVWDSIDDNLNLAIENSNKISVNEGNIINHETRITAIEQSTYNTDSVIYLDVGYSIFNLISNQSSTTKQTYRDDLIESFGEDLINAIEGNVNTIYYLEDRSKKYYSKIHINSRSKETNINNNTWVYINCTVESPYLLNGRSVGLNISIWEDFDQWTFEFLLDQSFSDSKSASVYDMKYLTTPPTSVNETGQLKVVALDSSQHSNASVTKYDGYLYIFY